MGEQQFVLALLRASMRVGSCDDLAESACDASEISEILFRNGILQTVFSTIDRAAERSELLKELKNILQPRYFVAIKQSVTQIYEGGQALERLAQAGFQCIMLKGWEMRKLYPDHTMRQMADLDILVRPYQYNRIKSVMEGLNYAAEKESSWKHDSFKKGEVHVEMHKRLTDDSGEIQRWEREMWNRTVSVRENVFKMSPEDYCVFHFVHMHKDFMNGSLGLRRIVDTWLLQKQGYDMDAVRCELQRFGLETFFERIIKLSRAVMGDEPFDENSEILLKHAFRYGIYGSAASYKAGRIAAMGKDLKSGKRSSAIKAVFLPYKRMKAHFPVLEKWPILLPWCWLKRIVHFLQGNVKENRARLDYSGIGEKEFQEMKSFFKAGGVQ